MLELWQTLISQAQILLAFQDVTFERPWAFWVLGLIPLLWLLATLRSWTMVSDWQSSNAQVNNVFRHPLIQRQFNAEKSPGLVKIQRNFSQILFRGWMQILRILLLLCLAVAWAGPQKIETLSTPQPQNKTFRDLMFVVESSASFLLPDYQINQQPATRMEVVKQVLDQFMAGLAGNRFGLTLYAEQAYTLMPLTDDLTTARLMLQRLRPYLAGRTDEAMGEALGLALQQSEHKTKTTQKRVVVLISDGLSRDSRIPIEEAIQYAQALKLPIYTIGVGSGSKDADQRIYSGLLYQPLETQSLQSIAERTGGRYFQIGSGADLQSVLAQIDQSEGVEVVLPKISKRTISLVLLPLMMALSLWVIYIGLLGLWRNQLTRGQQYSSNVTGGLHD